MKNLKQSVINKGWVDIQDEILGTITISKNDFWFSLGIMKKRVYTYILLWLLKVGKRLENG
jgi:hypothetical protein